LPVVGKTAADIDARAAFFLGMIEKLTSSSAFSSLGIVYHSNIHNILAHVYFALSEAYKGKFLNDGKGTNPTKQAALACAAICAVNPLRPVPGEEVREEHIYMNQMLAMRCACAIINHPVYLRSFDEQRRIYLQMQRYSFPSVRTILDATIANNGYISSNIAISLTPDEEVIVKSLISLFVVYKDLKIMADIPEPS
jgi:hypothetical protein